MLRCYDRVRVKVDKFLNLLYESHTKNQFIKSNEVDISSNIPCVFRGITRIELIKQCLDNNIEFFYIDTGYMGCYPHKKWHRLVKNNFQNLNHMSLEEIKNKIDIKIALNRFKEILQKDYQDFFPIKKQIGENILIIPPTPKVLSCLKVLKPFDLNVEQWIEKTIKEIKQYTDRNIIIRKKPNRNIRVKHNRLTDQLINDKIHCVVSFTSIASFEAVTQGYPTITLGPSAANYLAEKSISNIDNPFFPTDEQIKEHMFYLTVCQFNKDELKNGYAVETAIALQHNQKYINFNI